MANNRMYLRCKGCGEEIMLGKTIGHHWGFIIPEEDKGTQLIEFLWKHGHCCEGLSEETCGGVNPYDDMHFEPFELTYESQDDWGKRKSLQEIEKEKEFMTKVNEKTMTEKSELEAVATKIPVEYAQRIKDYAEANGKCLYDVLQDILIKAAKGL